MNIIVNLNKQLKKELFSETASIMNISTSIVERDFWIVWILNKIFSDNRKDFPDACIGWSQV